MTGNVDCCIGTIVAGPDPGVAGDPSEHLYTVQAWSITGSGRIVRSANQVVQRYDMGIHHFPLSPGDAVVVNIVGNKTVYTALKGAAHWDDC